VEQPEGTAISASPSAEDKDLVTAASRPITATDVLPAQACTTCGTTPAVNRGATTTTATNGPVAAAPASLSFVYAVGQKEARFPRLSVEKEFAQVAAQLDTTGMTDRQLLQTVLSKPENRYLARQMCWIMTIQGVETYILLPIYPEDLSLLIESLPANPTPSDLDVVIGTKGRIAPAEMCNGLLVPIVAVHQLYSFSREQLIQAIPKPEKIPAKEFAPAAEELFDRIMQMTDNAGAMDEHRALNYLAVRYPRIYEAVAAAHGRNESLTAVNVVPSPLSGARKLVDVIFSFTNRSTDVLSKQFVRVDVTDIHPFLEKKMSPYLDR
jgi:hypothetical protein